MILKKNKFIYLNNFQSFNIPKFIPMFNFPIILLYESYFIPRYNEVTCFIALWDGCKHKVLSVE